MMSESQNLVRKKVLIIDDESDMLFLLEEALRDKGYHVVLAGNGEEGIEKAKAEKPDLIVTDVMMPRLSGYEFVKKVRAEASLKKIPIIVMSVRGSMKDFFSLSDISCFIEKPFEVGEFLSKVDDVFGWSRQTREAGGELYPESAALRKALVVGVEQFYMERIQKTLASLGFFVVMTSEEKEAIERAAQIKPDFVFCQHWDDINVFDSLRVYSRIRAKTDYNVRGFVIYADERNWVEAKKIFKGADIVSFSNSEILIEKILALLQSRI